MPVGVRPARSRDPAEGSRPAAGRFARGQHRSAVRDHRRSASARPTIMRDGVRAALLSPLARRPRRLAGSDARLLRQQQGRRLPDRQLVALSRGARARRRVSRPRRQAAPLPRPRRHRRPRRRAELRGDPRAAGGQRQRRPAHHRAGRDHRQQVFGSRSRPAQPGDARRGDARGEPRRQRTARRSRRRLSTARWTRCRGTPTRPIARSSTKRRASSAISGRRRRSPKSPGSTSAAGRRRARRRRGSRISARSRGCSAGGNAG